MLMIFYIIYYGGLSALRFGISIRMSENGENDGEHQWKTEIKGIVLRANRLDIRSPKRKGKSNHRTRARHSNNEGFPMQRTLVWNILNFIICLCYRNSMPYRIA